MIDTLEYTSSDLCVVRPEGIIFGLSLTLNGWLRLAFTDTGVIGHRQTRVVTVNVWASKDTNLVEFDVRFG